jgi:hypothetical protein
MQKLILAVALTFASLNAFSGTWEDWYRCAAVTESLMRQEGLSAKQKHELALEKEVMATVACDMRKKAGSEAVNCTNGVIREMVHQAYLAYSNLSPERQMNVAYECSEYSRSASQKIEEICRTSPSDHLCQ